MRVFGNLTGVPPRRGQVLFPSQILRGLRAQRDDVRGHRDDVVVLPEHGIVPFPDAPLAGRVERVRRGYVRQPSSRRRELVPGVVEREVALRVL